MINVTEAEYIIQSAKQDYGTEYVHIDHAVGRVLAKDIIADRDLPPYDRVTMDGIAILFETYQKGERTFSIKGTQAAGDVCMEINNEECIEIMTGAALPQTANTVVRYEDITINDNGTATINSDTVATGQNIHYKGSDKVKGQALAKAGQIITPAIINTAASVGLSHISAKRLPKTVIISTGEELVDIDKIPSPYQVRRSNSYAIASILRTYNIKADMLHVMDDPTTMKQLLSECLEDFDILILSGGVSMGKFDYLPQVMEELHVTKLFHKVKQRPGKPFWFGISPDQKVVFAFPGNPVSAFMCMHRYFMPWLQTSLGIDNLPKLYAVLTEDYLFLPDLQYFLQIKITHGEDGRLMATPYEGNGSGDFTNLLYTDAFMELPQEQTNFKKGEAYRIWPYRNII